MLIATKIICIADKCGKEFLHSRHTFPKGFKFHCGFCGQDYIITEDCYAPKLKFKVLKKK